MPIHLSPERYVRYRWAADSIVGGRALDAGCGAGSGTGLLAERAGEVVGTDLSPAALAEARGSRPAENVSFREGDLRELPFADDEFDHVICFEALTHVAAPELVLDELHRVLRRGGLLFVSAPNCETYPPGNPLQMSQLRPGDLERLLVERLANVALYRQQSYHASLLAPAELFAYDDPATPIVTTTSKLEGGAPGSELHAVAVAGDGTLPAPPAQLVLGDQLDYSEQQAQLAEWQERAVKAEAAVVAEGRRRRGL